MTSFLQEKGSLTVELGTSWLSREEAASVKPGDLVKLDSFAGDGIKILYNGNFLATGELVIFGGSTGMIWGVRIHDFSDSLPSRSLPPREGAADFLPVSVTLGRASYSPQELSESGLMSMFSLDLPFVPDSWTLNIAGKPAARGEPAALYDNFAIRIKDVFYKSETASPCVSSGNLFDQDFATDSFRLYDFRRPDLLSRMGMNRIRDIHKTLAVQLSRRLTDGTEWTMLSAEMGNFKEEFDLKDNSVSYAAGRENTFRKNMERHVPASLIEPENPSHPLDKKVFEYTRKLREESPSAEPDNLILAARGKGATELLTKFPYGLLNGSWRNAADFSFEAINNEDKKHSETITDMLDKEFGVLIHIGTEERKKEGLYIFYPFLTLSPIVNLINH